MSILSLPRLLLPCLVFGSWVSADDTAVGCGVCSNGLEVTEPDAVFGSMEVTCSDLEDSARNGVYSRLACKIIQVKAHATCGCYPAPSAAPSTAPTISSMPSDRPSATPTSQPSDLPSYVPSTTPSKGPTATPTYSPVIFTSYPTYSPAKPVAFDTSKVDRRLDRFNYFQTQQNELNIDFGPSDWGAIECPNPETCNGWPDSWEFSRGWDLGQSQGCRWCPYPHSDCGVHHQSPIDLRRSFAINGTDSFNSCYDVHLMKYSDSTCTLDNLRDTRSIRVDRHALRVMQPIVWHETLERYYLKCRNGAGTAWGKIDFSRGFSQWWLLSHIDFKVPSEHTQEGKRYDAELQMYHFYSVTGKEAGVDNEKGADDYEVLNELICEWRIDEEKTRSECGLASIVSEYPSCELFTTPYSGRRRAAEEVVRAVSPADVILHNIFQGMHNSTFIPNIIDLSHDEDATSGEKKNDPASRKLQDSNHSTWMNYFALRDVKTEYYYRYSGTQTVPPCYGQFQKGNNRHQTNHWRVMKDPITVSKRQITEMHRLLRERIAPIDDALKPCQPDTAARVDPSTGRVDTARPLQKQDVTHFAMFCECEDWRSDFEEDREWCQMKDKEERFFLRPYNFPTNGF